MKRAHVRKRRGSHWLVVRGQPEVDAVGVSFTDLPVTSEKVYRALRERGI
jgi:hypothetical protein